MSGQRTDEPSKGGMTAHQALPSGICTQFARCVSQAQVMQWPPGVVTRVLLAPKDRTAGSALNMVSARAVVVAMAQQVTVVIAWSTSGLGPLGPIALWLHSGGSEGGAAPPGAKNGQPGGVLGGSAP